MLSVQAQPIVCNPWLKKYIYIYAFCSSLGKEKKKKKKKKKKKEKKKKKKGCLLPKTCSRVFKILWRSLRKKEDI